jgi:4-hydroxy-2-oxoheptanedioate aldolase
MDPTLTDHLNPLRRVWADERVALNGWIHIPSIITAEAMAAAGWDSITIDLQHGTADYASLLTLLPVVERSGAAPLVRIPWLEEGTIMRVLDAGAMGIIAPMIESPEAAARLVSACRYPPEGGRSFGPIRAKFAWGPDYVTRANTEVLALAMVETRQGVEALDEILTVEGLDGIYIGPGDLSFSHGFAPGFDRREPEILAIIMGILEKCQAAGVRCCLHTMTPEYAAEMAGRGFALVTVGGDARFVELTAASTVKSFRSLAGTPAGQRSRQVRG